MCQAALRAKTCHAPSLIDASLPQDKQDEFEAKYNFRFEEPGANEVACCTVVFLFVFCHARMNACLVRPQITTFPRAIPEAVRAKTSKRATAREARKQRKVEEKQKKIEEIKRLKSAKKQEIVKKLMEISEVRDADSRV